MAKNAAQRLRIEAKRFNEDPTPLFLAKPLETNILEWRFAMKGAPDTPYFGGVYHGKIVFPTDYPWKPPSIMMITPSGRFKVHTRICLSISDFHPESWCPSWTVNSILTGIISFFCSDEATVGSMEDTVERRRELALSSHEFNKKDRVFVELFGLDPEIQFAEMESRKKKGGKVEAEAGGEGGEAAVASPPGDSKMGGAPPASLYPPTPAAFAPAIASASEAQASAPQEKTKSIFDNFSLTSALGSITGLGGDVAPK